MVFVFASILAQRKLTDYSYPKVSSMSFFQHLPFELTEDILNHLDTDTLPKTLRTASFLRYPSEKRLYRIIDLSSQTNEGLANRQARFFRTVLENNRLAHHVVKLVMGGCSSTLGDERVNRLIGGAMKKMINLKDLTISGYPYITQAQLDSVPFSLTRLSIYEQELSDKATKLPLLSIFRAHPNLEDHDMDVTELPHDLVEALKAEQNDPSYATRILCPRVKRFMGYDEGLRLFLPSRIIEIARTGGAASEHIEDDDLEGVWLTPVLTQSYQKLRILEVWPDHYENTCFLPTIAPYLTSLTHLRIVDEISAIHADDYLLLSLGQIPALESVTLSSLLINWVTTVAMALNKVQLVCAVCPDITEVYIGGVKYLDTEMYYRYTKGQGLHGSLVREEVAYRPYLEPA